MELLDVQKEADSAGRKAIIFGAAALLLAGTFGYLLARFGGGTPDAESVVVAANQIPALTVLKEADLAVVQWPRTALLEGTVRDPNQLLNPGKVTTQELLKYEPVLLPRVASADGGVGVSTLIENNKRAFVVLVNEAVATATILHPGANVDVVATIADPRGQSVVTRTILQNIKVMAVGDRIDVEAQALQQKDGQARAPDQAANERRRVVTLSVDLAEAEVLSYATTQGKIDLAMRAGTDTAIASTSGVTTEKIMGSLKEDSDAKGAPEAPGPLPSGRLRSPAVHRPARPHSPEIYRGR